MRIPAVSQLLWSLALGMGRLLQSSPSLAHLLRRANLCLCLAICEGGLLSNQAVSEDGGRGYADERGNERVSEGKGYCIIPASNSNKVARS